MVDAVVCGDDVTLGRPAPYLIFRAMEATSTSSVHRVATVGDTTLDLQAGYNAGVRWNIGVLSGAHDRQSLEGAPHTHILPSVAELNLLWGAL
jgi:phosphoglycolate phosphatase-like HAD superfamily hydrolase